MTSALSVAHYIKQAKPSAGEVQLQKWLYYSQAWALAWTGRPLFSDRIEAWRMGPVAPSARRLSEQQAPAGSFLTGDEAVVVDAVLAHYGHMWGTQLTALTHAEDPWKNVWKEFSVNNRCSQEISHESMRRYYTKAAMDGKGPQAPVLMSTKKADDDQLLASARRNAERWRGTLDILAS